MNLFGLIRIGGRSKKPISSSYNEPRPVPREIKLDEDLGEILCPKCEGRGTVSEIMDDEGFIYDNISICSKCWGKGKLDWIEQATGVEPPYHGSSGTSGYVGISGISGYSGLQGISGTSGPDGIVLPAGITDSPYSDGITKLAGSAGRGVVNGC
jgi:hypothetical protein